MFEGALAYVTGHVGDWALACRRSDLKGHGMAVDTISLVPFETIPRVVYSLYR